MPDRALTLIGELFTDWLAASVPSAGLKRQKCLLFISKVKVHSLVEIEGGVKCKSSLF